MRSRKYRPQRAGKRNTLHKTRRNIIKQHKGGRRGKRPNKQKYKTIVLKTSKDLKKYNKKMLHKNNWLILYHSHQCHHCVTMLPVWNQFKKSHPKVNILEVESAMFDHVKMHEPVMFIPTIRFLNKQKNIFEEYSGEITPAKLKQFIKEHSLKKTNTKSNTKSNKEFSVIDTDVKKKYNREMLNKDQWLILYHSHHCPHCISMMPEWDRFKQMKPKINILEFESEILQDIEPPTQVFGYPTITYFDVNKAPIDFNGDRTAEEFTKFIRKMLI